MILEQLFYLRTEEGKLYGGADKRPMHRSSAESVLETLGFVYVSGLIGSTGWIKKVHGQSQTITLEPAPEIYPWTDLRPVQKE